MRMLKALSGWHILSIPRGYSTNAVKPSSIAQPSVNVTFVAPALGFPPTLRQLCSLKNPSRKRILGCSRCVLDSRVIYFAFCANVILTVILPIPVSHHYLR